MDTFFENTRSLWSLELDWAGKQIAKAAKMQTEVLGELVEHTNDALQRQMALLREALEPEGEA